jgi:hypothetical protein
VRGAKRPKGPARRATGEPDHHQVGNVPREALGDVVANLEASAETILNALDLVFSRAFPDMSRPAAQ